MISFELSEIQESIQDMARKFAHEEILPTVIERDRNAKFASEIMEKLGELGFLAMMVPEEYGGSGMDAISYVLAIEEISKVDASISIVLSVQNSLVNWILEHFGSHEQKDKYLRALAGGKIGAFCLSEPEAGSDASHQYTTAEFEEGKWVLNGTKNWISTANHADYYIVFAQTNQELKHKGIGCFIVENGTEGFVPAEKEDKMGMRSSDTSSIGITNCKVPEENMIGHIGQGFNIAMESLNSGRIGIAAQAVGVAQGAYELSAKYALERETFGKPIFKHQLIQSKLALMATSIDAARLLVHKAAWLKDNNMNYIKASAEAKLYAATIAGDVTREAVQIHGGYGYVREYHVERMMRDAKVIEIYEGTSEIQQIVIAREIEKEFS
jgi:alkylation response protein AidB-like acyl-CoA dehydrogenase